MPAVSVRRSFETAPPLDRAGPFQPESENQPVYASKGIRVVLLRALEQSDGVANNFLKNPVELEAHLLLDRWDEAKVNEIELSGPN